MAIINIISESIVDWKEKGWNDIVKRIEKFRELSGVEKFVYDDAEFYTFADAYGDLLKDIASILEGEFTLSNIELAEEPDLWKFNFHINGVAESIVLELEEPEWFETKFITDFNQILKKHGSERLGRLVCSTGVDRADQSFELCFITDEVYKKLKKNRPSFAE